MINECISIPSSLRERYGTEKVKRQKKRAEARIQILLITMLVMGRLGFLVFITMELILGAGYLDRCMQCFK